MISHGSDLPSGENLEYDPVFAALELAAQPGEERQAGDEIIAAEDPDFSDVAEKAKTVLAKSHDLRAAIYLARAGLRTKGLPGFADATSYIRFCLEDHWATCHPQLDEDDDNDPTMRVNAVLGLAGSDTILRDLRLAPLTKSNSFGRVSLRDIDVVDGAATATGNETVTDQAGVSAAFQDTKAEDVSACLEAARTALADVEAINAVFDAQIPGLGPDLGPLSKLLKRVVTVVALAAGEDVSEADAEGGAESAAPAAAASSGGNPGQITTQRDVQAALDRIIEYYARYEPSSPLPVLLRRAKRLVGADFLAIIADMAPSGRENVRLIGGLEEEE